MSFTIKTMKKISRNNNRRLSFKNLHDRDQHIKFQEKGHIYTVKGKTGYTSVTTLVHKHSKPFDENAAVKRIMENQNNEKYKGMTESDIKMLWKVNGIEARTMGTKMHYGIECHYNNETEPDLWKNLDEEYAQFQAFLKDHEFLEAFRTEWAVYDEANKISGSIDMVFKNKITGKYDIYDWKRTKEIKHRGFNKLQADFLSNIPDSNYWLYSLQLNVYKYILETNYNIDVGDLWLVAIHPDQPFYRKYLAAELQDVIPQLFSSVTPPQQPQSQPQPQPHNTDPPQPLLAQALRRSSRIAAQSSSSQKPNTGV